MTLLDRVPFIALFASLATLIYLSSADVITALNNLAFLWEYNK